MLISVAFFTMLGLSFMYQQATGIVRAKLLWVNQKVKVDRQTNAGKDARAPNEITAEKASFLRSVVAKSLTTEEQDKMVEIAKAISVCSSSLDEGDIASFANVVRKESKKYGYDWELILAIIRTESQFNVRAISNKGAIGLMQVMPSTAKWLSSQLGLEYGGLNSLYDPEYNVKLGTHYLHMMHQKFGDIEKAIAAYNRGPTGLVRYLNQGKKFPSRYLVKVMDHYKELKNSPDKRAS